MGTGAPPRPGRPRSERARRAVIDAAADLLVEGGLPATTIEAVAARAGVSKVTIYKWWPNRCALAVDAYFERFNEPLAVEDAPDARTALTWQLEGLTHSFSGRGGSLMAELVGQAQSDRGLGEQIRDRWMTPRRVVGRQIMRRGIERGEIRGDVDVEATLDMIFGPVYFRLSMGHGPLDAELCATIVRQAFAGIAAEM